MNGDTVSEPIIIRNTSNEIQPATLPQSPDTTLHIYQDSVNNTVSATTANSGSSSTLNKLCEALPLIIGWGIMGIVFCAVGIPALIIIAIVVILVAIFVVIVLALSLALGYIFVVIIKIVVQPLLLISLLVTRFRQLILSGTSYDEMSIFKFRIRWVISTYLLYFICEAGVSLLPIAKYAPAVKDALLLGLPLSDWCIIAIILAAIYIFNYLVTFLPYMLPWIPLDCNESGIIVPESVSEIISCLFFRWAESVVAGRVPAMRHHQIAGLQTRRWILVANLVVIGYNLIRLIIHLLVWLLIKIICNQNPGPKLKILQVLLEIFLSRKYAIYYAAGLRRRISLVLTSTLILIVWVSYFGSHIKAKKVMDFGTWSCVSVLIFSLLWLVKACVLLTWEASAIYGRLSCKILETRKQLYFLDALGRYKLNIFNMEHRKDDDDLLLRVWSMWKKSRVEFFTHLGHKDSATPLFDLRQVAHYFLSAKAKLSQDTYIDDTIEYLKSDILSGDDSSSSTEEKLKGFVIGKNNCNDVAQVSNGRATGVDEGTTIFEKFLKFVRDCVIAFQKIKVAIEKKIEECKGKKEETEEECKMKKEDIEEEWATFLRLLKREEINLESIRTWMERAQNSCLSLANTLSSAKEGVDCLNNIITGFLIGVTFIMWLLLTKLATTKVLVLIASPLLAATFIFGDTCKALFQGIIFVYIQHFLDVGDLCIIDEKMVEVKAIGIWKTTFSRVDKAGGKEKVMYQNSDLANKKVINHKTDFDWDDTLEFNVDSMGKKKIQELKEHLIRKLPSICHIINGGDELTSSSHNVITLATEAGVKIVVHIKRKKHDIDDWTFFECLQLKNRLRCDSHLEIQSLIDEFNKQEKKEESETSGLKICTAPLQDLQFIAEYARESMFYGVQIDIKMEHDIVSDEYCEKDIMSDEYCEKIGKDEILRVVHKEQIGLSEVALYIRYLYKSRNLCGSVAFLSPRFLSATYMEKTSKSEEIAEVFQRKASENMLFLAPYSKGNHWVLYVIDPFSLCVYYLDSLQCYFDSRPDMKEEFDKALDIFQVVKLKNGKPKIIRWKTVKCPQQTNNIDCGYFVLRFMKEIIEHKISMTGTIEQQNVRLIEQCFNSRVTYSQQEIDEVRNEWSQWIREFLSSSSH